MSASIAADAAPPVRRRTRSLSRQRRWALWGSYAALMVFVVMFLVPPFHMLVTSFKTSAEVSGQTANPWLVTHPTLRNYSELLADANFRTFFLNSVKVTVCVVALSMAISILAAFSLSRMRFFGSGVLATGVFLTYLIPDSLLFIPFFQIIGKLGMINNVWAMVIVYPTLAVPFCTWIMIGYFASIPKELDEAALIDGASWMQILFRVFIPVAMPGIIAATIFAFTVSWGQFIYPLAYLYSSDQMVLTVGIISDLIRADVFEWGKIMAGSLMAAAPPVLDLRLPDGLLHRRADGRRDQGITAFCSFIGTIKSCQGAGFHAAAGATWRGVWPAGASPRDGGGCGGAVVVGATRAGEQGQHCRGHDCWGGVAGPGVAGTDLVTPSIWHSGLSSRRNDGAAASCAISGSASRNCNCEPKHAAPGTRRTSQARPRGRRSGRGRDGRGARGRAATGGMAASMRAAARVSRPPRRRSRPHTRQISGAVSHPPTPRAATAAHSPSIMRARRSTGAGTGNAGAGDETVMNETRTQTAMLGKSDPCVQCVGRTCGTAADAKRDRATVAGVPERAQPRA